MTAIPKPIKGTAKADRAETRRARMALDRRESANVKARSGGRCEAVEEWPIGRWYCQRPATEIHHMLGGRGRRLSAEGVKALRKQHLCRFHHVGITGDVGGRQFKRIGGPVPEYTDTYRRLR